MKKVLFMAFVAALAVEASATLAEDSNRALLTYGYEGAALDYGIKNVEGQGTDANGYSGCFCSVDTAKTWFGGNSSAADISTYLKNNLASLQSKFTAENGFTEYTSFGQTSSTEENNYIIMSQTGAEVSEGDYVAIAMCARTEGTYYRVFTATYFNGANDLIFTGSDELGGDPTYARGYCAADAADWELASAGSNVPEPTSGLLMLLGLAGLALRRKRA